MIGTIKYPIKDWIDFNDIPEEAEQFMLKHFGFPNMDALSDEECKELSMRLHHIEGIEHGKRLDDIDENDPQYWDEVGLLLGKPLSKYGMMIGGMIVYIGRQFQEGGKRYKPEDDEIEIYDCPLINIEISIGDCYEIQLARIKCLKMNCLTHNFNIEKSNQLCDKCPFNQLLSQQG
jgi:hypothetical protein